VQFKVSNPNPLSKLLYSIQNTGSKCQKNICMFNPTSEKYIKFIKSQSTHPFTLGQEKKPFIVAHANSKTKNPKQIQVT